MKLIYFEQHTEDGHFEMCLKEDIDSMILELKEVIKNELQDRLIETRDELSRHELIKEVLTDCFNSIHWVKVK